MMIKRIEILDFMTAKLGLSGNELVLFGICWKLSDRGEKPCELNYTDVSVAMGTTIPTMYNCLKKLAERGYVVKMDDGRYQVSETVKT